MSERGGYVLGTAVLGFPDADTVGRSMHALFIALSDART